MTTKTRIANTQIPIPREKTNVFFMLPGHGIYVNASGVPVQAFQMFIPGRKVDFLFGTN